MSDAARVAALMELLGFKWNSIREQWVCDEATARRLYESFGTDTE